MTVARLPDGAALSAALIEQDFRRRSVALPRVLGGHSFNLMIPADWRPFPVPEVTTVPEPGASIRLLAQFTGPETNRFTPFVQVQCGRLAREISAKDWLRFYCAQVLYAPRQIDAVSNSIADALVGFEIAGRSVLARLVVRLFESSAYIVLAGVAAQQYESSREMLALVVRSFVLAGRKPGGQVESWQTLAGPVGPRLGVPRSWAVETIAGPDGRRGALDLVSRNERGVWLGQIRLRWLDNAVSGSDAEEVQKMIYEFADAGVKPERNISRSARPAVTEAYTLVRESVFEAVLKGDTRAFELWQISLHGSSFRVFIAMLTPARTEAFYLWALNRRALEIITNTLR